MKKILKNKDSKTYVHYESEDKPKATLGKKIKVNQTKSYNKMLNLEDIASILPSIKEADFDYDDNISLGDKSISAYVYFDHEIKDNKEAEEEIKNIFSKYNNLKNCDIEINYIDEEYVEFNIYPDTSFYDSKNKNNKVKDYQSIKEKSTKVNDDDGDFRFTFDIPELKPYEHDYGDSKKKKVKDNLKNKRKSLKKKKDTIVKDAWYGSMWAEEPDDSEGDAFADAVADGKFYVMKDLIQDLNYEEDYTYKTSKGTINLFGYDYYNKALTIQISFVPTNNQKLSNPEQEIDNAIKEIIRKKSGKSDEYLKNLFENLDIINIKSMTIKEYIDKYYDAKYPEDYWTKDYDESALVYDCMAIFNFVGWDDDEAFDLWKDYVDSYYDSKKKLNKVKDYRVTKEGALEGEGWDYPEEKEEELSVEDYIDKFSKILDKEKDAHFYFYKSSSKPYRIKCYVYISDNSINEDEEKAEDLVKKIFSKYKELKNYDIENFEYDEDDDFKFTFDISELMPTEFDDSKKRKSLKNDKKITVHDYDDDDYFGDYVFRKEYFALDDLIPGIKDKNNNLSFKTSKGELYIIYYDGGLIYSAFIPTNNKKLSNPSKELDDMIEEIFRKTSKINEEYLKNVEFTINDIKLTTVKEYKDYDYDGELLEDYDDSTLIYSFYIEEGYNLFFDEQTAFDIWYERWEEEYHAHLHM